MRPASPHQAAIIASGLGTYPIESVLIGFALLVFILLLVVRVRRGPRPKTPEGGEHRVL